MAAQQCLSAARSERPVLFISAFLLFFAHSEDSGVVRAALH